MIQRRGSYLSVSMYPDRSLSCQAQKQSSLPDAGQANAPCLPHHPICHNPTCHRLTSGSCYTAQAITQGRLASALMLCRRCAAWHSKICHRGSECLCRWWPFSGSDIRSALGGWKKNVACLSAISLSHLSAMSRNGWMRHLKQSCCPSSLGRSLPSRRPRSRSQASPHGCTPSCRTCRACYAHLSQSAAWTQICCFLCTRWRFSRNHLCAGMRSQSKMSRVSR